MNFNFLRKLNMPSGYTLIELVISVVIVSVIVITLAPFLSSTNLTFNQIKTRKSIVIDNTIGLELVSQDLTMIHNLISANSKFVQFTTTLDTNLTIEYKLDSNGSLTKKMGFGTYHLVAQNIDYGNSQFTYFDANGNMGSPVKRIRLYLLYNLNGVTAPLTMDIVPYTFR